MPVKQKTVTVATCDENGCSNEIANPSDGLIYTGIVKPVTGNALLRTTSQDGSAICRSCFLKKFSSYWSSELSRLQMQLQETERALSRAESRSSSYSDSGSSYYDPPVRSGGPTGPCSPPELPRCVDTIRALIPDQK